MSDTIVYACGECGVTVTSGHSPPEKPCRVCGAGDGKYESPKWTRKGRLD